MAGDAAVTLGASLTPKVALGLVAEAAFALVLIVEAAFGFGAAEGSFFIVTGSVFSLGVDFGAFGFSAILTMSAPFLFEDKSRGERIFP